MPRCLRTFRVHQPEAEDATCFTGSNLIRSAASLLHRRPWCRAGLLTGLVVDSGDGVTHLVPVIEVAACAGLLQDRMPVLSTSYVVLKDVRTEHGSQCLPWHSGAHASVVACTGSPRAPARSDSTLPTPMSAASHAQSLRRAPVCARTGLCIPAPDAEAGHCWAPRHRASG